jgi:membrane-associated PAP2 superfamily phosphatase
MKTNKNLKINFELRIHRVIFAVCLRAMIIYQRKTMLAHAKAYIYIISSVGSLIILELASIDSVKAPGNLVEFFEI